MAKILTPVREEVWMHTGAEQSSCLGGESLDCRHQNNLGKCPGSGSIPLSFLKPARGFNYWQERLSLSPRAPGAPFFLNGSQLWWHRAAACAQEMPPPARHRGARAPFLCSYFTSQEDLAGPAPHIAAFRLADPSEQKMEGWAVGFWHRWTTEVSCTGSVLRLCLETYWRV